MSWPSLFLLADYHVHPSTEELLGAVYLGDVADLLLEETIYLVLQMEALPG